MTTPRDFPEEFHHENGMYAHHCIGCGEEFLGHKRRRICKVCDPALSDDREKFDQIKRELTSPLISLDANLDIALGGILFRDKVIQNLREQIKNLRKLASFHYTEEEMDFGQYEHIKKD